jgi:hypothetical protein
LRICRALLQICIDLLRKWRGFVCG